MYALRFLNMLADNIILCDIVGESEGQIVCHDGSGDNHNYHTDDDAVNATAGPRSIHLKAKTPNHTVRRTPFEKWLRTCSNTDYGMDE